MNTRSFYVFILLTILFGMTQLTYGSCGVHGITILPSASTLPPNGQIIVVGYAFDQTIAEQLASSYPIFLVSSLEQIPLKLLEICKGDFALTQAVLRPKKPLKTGATYRLMIQNLPSGSEMGKFDHRLHKFVPIKWTITGDADHSSPKWLSPPKELRKHYDAFACGPNYGVVFGIESSDSSATMVKTSVRAVGESAWKTYYLEVIEHKIDIGCGMCAGAFSLLRAKEYEVLFALVDLAGNYTSLKGPPIRFSRPEEMNAD